GMTDLIDKMKKGRKEEQDYTDYIKSLGRIEARQNALGTLIDRLPPGEYQAANRVLQGIANAPPGTDREALLARLSNAVFQQAQGRLEAAAAKAEDDAIAAQVTEARVRAGLSAAAQAAGKMALGQLAVASQLATAAQLGALSVTEKVLTGAKAGYDEGGVTGALWGVAGSTLKVNAAKALIDAATGRGSLTAIGTGLLQDFGNVPLSRVLGARPSLAALPQAAAARLGRMSTAPDRAAMSVRRIVPAPPPPTPKAARLGLDEPFDPLKRRPSLRGAARVAEPGPVSRRSSEPADPSMPVGREAPPHPEARVSVFHDPLGKHVRPVSGSTPQQRGHDYERAVRDDLAGGSSYRVRHEAGDRPRVGDVGQYEVKYMTHLGSEQYDQLWRDLIAYNRAHVIMPRLSLNDQRNLAQMAALFEKKTGIRPQIAVRETGGTAE
ncbi:hypothetical protein ACWGB8_35065, partial [Kitasatospora sp. NPDC054939]